MKYIRTKDGIAKLDDDWALFCKEYANNKQANTIEELCDEFVNQKMILSKQDIKDILKYAKDELKEEIIYGAIWIILPNGAPRLEPVAKMNDKGELELL